MPPQYRSSPPAYTIVAHENYTVSPNIPHSSLPPRLSSRIDISTRPQDILDEPKVASPAYQVSPSPYDVNYVPSTSVGSNRPLPRLPDRVPTASTYAGPSVPLVSPGPSHYASYNTETVNDSQTRDEETDRDRTPSAPPGTLQAPQPLQAPLAERLHAPLPPTPSGTLPLNQGPRRNRSVQSSSPSLRSLGSSLSSPLSAPFSFDSSEPPPWVSSYAPDSNQPAPAMGDLSAQDAMRFQPASISGYSKVSDAFTLYIAKGNAYETPAYGRKEPVMGYIQINELDKIREIEAILEGVLLIAFTGIRAGGETIRVPLLENRQKLYSSNFRQPPGSVHQFQFTFPEVCDASRVPLPPTWKLEKPGISAEVQYKIRVYIRRSGMARNKEMEAPVQYFPRTAPPPRETGRRPRLRTLLLEENLPPMGRFAAARPTVPTRFEARFSLEDPLIYPSGTTITYTAMLTSEEHTSVTACLDVEVQLIQVTELIVRKKKEEIRRLIATGINAERQDGIHELRSPDHRRTVTDAQNIRQGGSVVIKGACIAGGQGEEMSWQVNGTAAVKYFMRFVVVPRENIAEYADFRANLPHFEHQEEVVLTSDSSAALATENEACLPALGLRYAHGRPRADTTAKMVTTTGLSSSPTSNNPPVAFFGSLGSSRSGLTQQGLQASILPTDNASRTRGNSRPGTSDERRGRTELW